MADNRPPHECASCRLCEAVAPDLYRRCWKHEAKAGLWHVIADGPDLMARLPRQAHFVTVLAYQPAPDGFQACYRGPLYWEFDADDPAQALEDLQRCIELLHTVYGIPYEAIHVRNSGGRGYHVTLPAVVFGAEAGHPQLPRLYAAMIQTLFPSAIAPTLDRSIYSMGKGRMWRLPNRRRSDTGRYKVPVSIREVLHKPYAALEALTVRPRKGIFWPPEGELSPCPGLVQLYQETAAAIERTHVTEHPRHRDDSGSSGNVDVLLNRCAFIRHCRDDAVTLTEPEWYAMISNVGRCIDGQTFVHQLSAPYPGYSPKETDAKIAHALQDTGPHTCAFIRGLGFAGCPPSGCGVKAPIGLGYAGTPSLVERQAWLTAHGYADRNKPLNRADESPPGATNGGYAYQGYTGYRGYRGYQPYRGYGREVTHG
jgi:hypothetical protein